MLLDSSFLIALMRESIAGTDGPASRKLDQLGETGISMPLFVLCELEASALSSRRPDEQQKRIERLTELLPVEYPREGFADTYARIENDLRRSGTPIPVMDLLIAALAVCLDEPLLTSDVEHFSRVRGLSVESF